jgi:hypothetical protein
MIEVWPVIHVFDPPQSFRCAGVAAACGCPGIFNRRASCFEI